MKRAIQVHEKDNVATAPKQIRASESVRILTPEGKTLQIMRPNEDVPAGHKLALVKCRKGTRIVKYGQTIGIAVCAVEPGDWVHTHNVRSGRMSVSGKGGK